MSKTTTTEAQKIARANYDIRMRKKGFKRYTIWLPERDINESRGKMSVQKFFEDLLKYYLDNHY